MVAMGAADINYEFGIHAWDIAAGDLIVREAGGVCIDPAGNFFVEINITRLFILKNIKFNQFNLYKIIYNI